MVPADAGDPLRQNKSAFPAEPSPADHQRTLKDQPPGKKSTFPGIPRASSPTILCIMSMESDDGVREVLVQFNGRRGQEEVVQFLVGVTE
eukprot:2842400-Rhodomonas_salina.1